MKWPDFYNDLLFYILNLYPGDITHETKRRLMKTAGIPLFRFKYTLSDLDLWYTILEYAQTYKQITPLLEAIIVDIGKPDEYLAGALQAIKENKPVSTRTARPDDVWKGDDNYELTKEKIIGRRSNLLPISFLENGTSAARSVVRIELDNETGTGFLLEGGWLLTNNHVLPSIAAARTARVQFNFQTAAGALSDKIQRVVAEKEIRLDPSPSEFLTDVEEDWAIVKFREQDMPVAGTYGFLRLSETTAKEGDFVNIIQHPLGGPKQLGIYNNLVVYADDERVQYLTDTNAGSSGSPVLNSNWEVVGLHHSGGWLKDDKSGLTIKRNQGTPVQKLRDGLKRLKSKNNGTNSTSERDI